MRLLYKVIPLVLFFSLFVNESFSVERPAIPDPLVPWKDWVLHDHEDQLLCTPAYNNINNLRCDWPSHLDLTITEGKATFRQEWQVHNERWIQLPGDDKNWPQSVILDDKPAIVISKKGVPQISVPQGRHIISGQFTWKNIPEYLRVPSHSGVVKLTLKGREIEFPNLDNKGRLWLQAQTKKEEKIENRLKLQSYRLIDDRIPARIVNSLTLDVAGTAREIRLGPVFSPDTYTPVSLTSVLPAKLEQDGSLRVQVRPGQWKITITSRYNGPVSSMEFVRPEDEFWPEEEIWSFLARTNLRIVEIEGIQSIDPMQTPIPDGWRNYPAYRLLAGNVMTFKEIKRGDPQPAPDQLSLQRNLWLRFDGTGYTIQDTITGKKSTEWRLEMNPPLKLGRVSVDGAEQFITKREGQEKAGVELRKGRLNLVADSEYGSKISTMPATGWDHDFQKVSAYLNLPPGWRLLHATGIDNIPRTWVKRWTLLDLFIVLIFTIAVAKLYSNPMALIAFATLVLIYHEPNAPRWIWLALLLGFALLKNIPE